MSAKKGDILGDKYLVATNGQQVRIALAKIDWTTENQAQHQTEVGTVKKEIYLNKRN